MPKKFLLKAGTHADDNGVFKAGDIVTSDSDLAERWPEKFATPQVSDPKTAAEAAETRAALLAQLEDLDTKFPVPGIKPAARFVPVPNTDPKNPPAEATDDEDESEPADPADPSYYDSMTLTQLKAAAEEKELDMKGLKTKADFVAALKAADAPE